MKKRLMSILTVLALAAAMTPQLTAGAEPVTNISVGEYLEMGHYLGEPILWRCIGRDREGSPLMFSDQILSIKPFDAATTDDSKGSHARDIEAGDRANCGSNYWQDSNLRTWLQSSAPEGEVQWDGNPPTADKLAWYDKDNTTWKGENENDGHNGYNAYDQEAGFLHDFTSNERRAIKKVTHDSLVTGVTTTPQDEKELPGVTGSAGHEYGVTMSDVMKNYDEAYKEQVEDTMFLLDVKEMHDMVYMNEKSQGESGIFEDNYYIGTLTASAVEQAKKDTDFVNDMPFNSGAGDYWHCWLRSPNASNIFTVRLVTTGGLVSHNWASDGYYGIRPAFYLDIDAVTTEIGGKGTKTRPYILSKTDAFTDEELTPPAANLGEEGTGLEYTGSPQALIDKTKTDELLNKLKYGKADGGDTDVKFQYKLDTASQEWSDEIPTGTDAGKYNVHWRFVGNSMYNDRNTGDIVTVEIKQCDLSQVSPPTPIRNLKYTGQPQTLVNDGGVNDLHGAGIGWLEYWTSDKQDDPASNASNQSSNPPQGTNAGTYYVWYAAVTNDKNHKSWVTPKDPSNPQDGEYKCVPVTISKAQPTATVTPREGLVYNGTEQQLLQQAEADLEGVELKFSVNDEHGDFTAGMPTAKAAGHYTVYYKSDDSTNYEAIPQGQVEVDIAKSDVDVSAGDVSLTYGEQLTLTAAVKKAVTLSSLTFRPEADKVKFYVDNGTDTPTLLGEAVDVSYTSPTDKDGGTATLTLTQAQYKGKLKPGDNKVYAVYGGSVNLNGGSDETVNVRLDRKALTYTVTAASRPYADVTKDRPDPSTVVAATFEPSGVEDGDEAKIAATANIESPDADSYSSVSLSNIRVLPSGEGSADGQYYTVAETSRENVDLTAPVVISPVSPEKWVKAPIPKTLTFRGSSNQQALVEAGSVPEGCQMQYSTDGSSYDVAIPTAADIGQYNVFWKVVALDNSRGSGKKNYTDYTAVQSTVIAKITDKAAPHVTAPTAKEDLTYQPGVEQELVTEGSAYGGTEDHPLTMEYSLGTSAMWSEDIPTAEHAGTYTVYYRVNADENYNGQEAKSIEVTIKKAKPVVVSPPEPADDLTYTGNPIVLIKAAVVTGGTAEYALADDNDMYTPLLPSIVATTPGQYTVYWRVKGNDDYEDLTPSNNTISVTITSADLTRPAAKTGLKYTGEPQELITEGRVGGTGKFEYTFYYQGEDSTDNWSETIPQGTNAGTYTVKWRVTGDPHYSDAYGTFDVITIDKADWIVSTPPTAKQLKANGEEQELVTAGVCDNGGEFKYALDANSPESFGTAIPKASEPNTYMVYYKIEGDTNHNEYGPFQVQTHIVPDTGKDLLTVEPPKGITNLVYTGEEQTLIEAGNATGNSKTYTMYYSLTNDGEDWSESLPKGVDAKEYTVWYKVDGDDDFESVEPTMITVAIAKADIEYTEPAATDNKLYNGEPVNLVTAGRITKGEGHFEYSLTKESGYSQDIPTGNEAREYTVWYKVVSDNENYNGTSEPKSISVTLETTDIPPVKLEKTETGYTLSNLDFSGLTAPYTVICALYKDGTLVALKTFDVTDAVPATLDIDTTAEADSAKLLVWKTLDGMEPLRDAVTVTRAAAE